MGVSTLSRAVAGEKHNFPMKLRITPGIGRHGKFFGRHEVMKLKFREVLRVFRNVSQRFGTIFQIFGRTLIYIGFCSNSIC